MSDVLPVAFDRVGAARFTGVSPATITRAVDSGDLQVVSPRVDGRPIHKTLILRTELERWLADLPRKGN